MSFDNMDDDYPGANRRIMKYSDEYCENISADLATFRPDYGLGREAPWRGCSERLNALGQPITL